MDNSHTDWAYLTRFSSENETLKTFSSQDRIVFIGDSIIAEWKNHALFVDNLHFINRGINGQTTSQIAHRFQADVIDLRPKCVVILAGTNDIAENRGPITLEQVQNHFHTMLRIAESHAIKVIVCSVLPTTEYYWNKKIKPFEKIKALNAFLKSIANESDIYYVDLYTSFTANGEVNSKLFRDGVHPNCKGYEIMTSLLIQSKPNLLTI